MESDQQSTRLTWKRLQLDTWTSFSAWLDAGRKDADIVRVQRTLTRFILSHINDAAAAQRFVKCWPVVLEQCNDSTIYNCFMNILAYAHVHFLDRYRRFYSVLEELYRIGYLPMKRNGIRVLDVGTGPAPCLYAVQDFYEQIRMFADRTSNDRLRLGLPQLRCVEQSQEMAHFFHLFSEVTYRPGPYQAQHLDFSRLDLQSLRRRSEAASKAAEEADWDDPYAPWPFAPEDYKHELYIFSNFLTQREFVTKASAQIRGLFMWLGPGQEIVVLGASGGDYPLLYSEVEEIALDARVDRVLECPGTIPCRYDCFSAERVREHYREVLARLHRLCPTLTIPDRIRPNSPLRNAEPPPRASGQFSVRLYRRSRVSPGRKWRRQ